MTNRTTPPTQTFPPPPPSAPTLEPPTPAPLPNTPAPPKTSPPPSTLPRPAVFFDRDGTLMDEVHYCSDPALVRAIPGLAAALRKLRLAGYWRFIITNQSGIARGLITPEQYHAVHAELLRQLEGELDAAFMSPDHPDSPSPRRKPGTGLIQEAAASFPIDFTRSWFVGDKAVDIHCGKNAALRTILVRTGYGHAAAPEVLAAADAVCNDATEAIHLILSLTPSTTSAPPTPKPQAARHPD